MIISDFINYFDEKNPYHIFDFDAVPVLPAVYAALMENKYYSSNDLEILKEFFIYCDENNKKKKYYNISYSVMKTFIKKANNINNRNIIKQAIYFCAYYYVKYGDEKVNAVQFIFDVYDYWMDYINYDGEIYKLLHDKFMTPEYIYAKFNKDKLEINNLRKELKKLKGEKEVLEKEIRELGYLYDIQQKHLESCNSDGKNDNNSPYEYINFIQSAHENEKDAKEIAKDLESKGFSLVSIGTLLCTPDSEHRGPDHRNLQKLARKLLGKTPQKNSNENK